MTPVQEIFHKFLTLTPADFDDWLIVNKTKLMQSEKDHLSTFYHEGYDDGDRRADYQFEQQYKFYTTQND